MAIVLQKRTALRAYLTAEYFPAERLIFFWYIVNATSAQDDDAGVQLLQKLFSECDKVAEWDHLLAEVESENVERARRKVRRFKQYAAKLARDERHRVFKIAVDYVMPAHDAALLDEAEKHELPAWLVYACSAIDPPRVLSGRLVGKLVTALVINGYRDDHDSRYRAYLRRHVEKLSALIPDTVPLIANIREMK